MSSSADAIKCRIVRWLLNGGLGFRASHDAIGNEVLFSLNWRRADLLILSEEFHALEIKGPADTTSLLGGQLVDYHKVFEKVSVVTVGELLGDVRKIASKRTGIILCDGDEPTVIRQATRTSRLSKEDLCRFLNRRDLTSCLGSRGKSSVDELRSEFARNTLKAIRQTAYDSLRRRYSRLFAMFLEDVGDSQFAEDELRSLSGMVDAIRK